MKSTEYESPCGRLLLGVHGSEIVICDWIIGDRTALTLRRLTKFLKDVKAPDDETLLQMGRHQLDEYFAKRRQQFDLPLSIVGTEFQRHVWMALSRIPYGETVSYKEVAFAVGMPGGVRAVASAIAANPVSILIPCHRVIGADGSLTGYAGGLEAKRHLLQLETLTQTAFLGALPLKELHNFKPQK